MTTVTIRHFVARGHKADTVKATAKTTLLLSRAAAILEAAESMIGFLRDHTDELARGEAPHTLAAHDAYTELQTAAHALRLHFDSPSVEDVGAFDALVAMHAYMLESNHHCTFELAYTRQAGWMARICAQTAEHDPHSAVLASGQGDSPEEACEQALDRLTTHADIGEDEVPY